MAEMSHTKGKHFNPMIMISSFTTHLIIVILFICDISINFHGTFSQLVPQLIPQFISQLILQFIDELLEEFNLQLIEELIEDLFIQCKKRKSDEY